MEFWLKENSVGIEMLLMVDEEEVLWSCVPVLLEVSVHARAHEVPLVCLRTGAEVRTKPKSQNVARGCVLKGEKNKYSRESKIHPFGGM